MMGCTGISVQERQYALQVLLPVLEALRMRDNFYTMRNGTTYELFRNRPNTPISHANCKNKFLGPLQKEEIMRSLVTNSNMTVKQIQQTTNALLDSYEHMGPALGPSVKRYVWKQRNMLLAKQMEGVETPGRTKVQILRKLCEDQMLQDQIKLHKCYKINSNGVHQKLAAGASGQGRGEVECRQSG